MEIPTCRRSSATILGIRKSRKDKRQTSQTDLITALCAHGAGVDWRKAIPAAAAIELIHNFSLIHDDIEDNGEMRRGKPAVWKKWGLAKGINSGDAMFAAAFDLLAGLEEFGEGIILGSIQLISKVCLDLTAGQQQDIDFENRAVISLSEYFQMIEGKTAALMRCSAQMGALLAGLDQADQEVYAEFGHNLGVAFQIFDDCLGVWGNPHLTGKSASSDLLEKKKSYPVVLGLQQSARFRVFWQAGHVGEESLTLLADWLEEDGVKADIEQAHLQWTQKAVRSLEALTCSEEKKDILKQFIDKLLTRQN